MLLGQLFYFDFWRCLATLLLSVTIAIEAYVTFIEYGTILLYDSCNKIAKSSIIRQLLRSAWLKSYLRWCNIVFVSMTRCNSPRPPPRHKRNLRTHTLYVTSSNRHAVRRRSQGISNTRGWIFRKKTARFHILNLHAYRSDFDPTKLRPPPRTTKYDTDSFLIGLDGHASYCMSNTKDDAIGPIRKVRVRIRGVAGTLHSAYTATLKWTILDDNGVPRDLIIPNGYIVEELPIRLLSPQHLAQIYKAQHGTSSGTCCIQTDANAILVWDRQRYTKTVPLNSSNVPVFQSAPSYRRFDQLEHTHDSRLQEPQCFATHIIPPDGAYDQPTTTNQSMDDEFDMAGPKPQSSTTPIHIIPDQCQIIPDDVHYDHTTNEGDNNSFNSTNEGDDNNENDAITANEGDEHIPITDGALAEWAKNKTAKTLQIDKDTPIFEEQRYSKIESVKQEMMFWHLRLGHLPHERMMAMAKAGDLPKRFLGVPMPECAACRFCRATKVPWRTKGHEQRKTNARSMRFSGST